MAESAAFQANAKANAKTKQIAKEHLLVAIARDNGIPCKSSLFREPALKVASMGDFPVADNKMDVDDNEEGLMQIHCTVCGNTDAALRVGIVGSVL